MNSPATQELTQKERLCRLLNHQAVDRPPRWEAIAFWSQTVSAWKGEGGLSEETDVREYYDIEPMPMVSGGLGFTRMQFSGPPVQSRVIEDDGFSQIVEDDLGAVQKIRIDGGQSMPQFIRFPVGNHDDWLRKIKPRLRPEEHDFSVLSGEKGDLCRNADIPVCFGMVGLYAFWRNLWGEENLAYAFYDCPGTLHDMAKTWLEMHCQCSPKVFETIPIDWVFFHEDMAFKNGPLIGPNLFEPFMMPYYRELFSHLRSHGQRHFMLDSDGNNGKILDLFMELGINGLFPFEIAAGYDVLEFRKTHPEFVIFGGIDKRVLNQGKDAIKREVMAKIPVLWESGSFIPSIDHAVQPCPQEDFEYFLELTREIVAQTSP